VFLSAREVSFQPAPKRLSDSVVLTHWRSSTSIGIMNEEEIITWLKAIPGVVVETVAAQGDAPEIAWGDSFAYDAASAALPADHRWPFATVITKDYPGFDESSQLNRHGVFRVNVNVGRDRFTQLVGYPPSEHKQRTPAVDPATKDVIIPHPQYGQQGWLAVVSPGVNTSALLRELLGEAHDRAASRL